MDARDSSRQMKEHLVDNVTSRSLPRYQNTRKNTPLYITPHRLYQTDTRLLIALHGDATTIHSDTSLTTGWRWVHHSSCPCTRWRWSTHESSSSTCRHSRSAPCRGIRCRSSQCLRASPAPLCDAVDDVCCALFCRCAGCDDLQQPLNIQPAPAVLHTAHSPLASGLDSAWLSVPTGRDRHTRCSKQHQQSAGRSGLRQIMFAGLGIPFTIHSE